MKLKHKNHIPIVDTFNCEDCFITINRMVKQGIKVDTIVTSPPYNTGKSGTSDTARNNYDGKYDVYMDTKTVEEYIEWTVSLFNKFNDILCDNGVICYNMSYGSNSTSADSSTVNLVWLTILLDLYYPIGGLVYDPFMGTGTVAVGSFYVGDHFIGSEISESQVEYSKNRLKSVGGTYHEKR